VALAAVAELPQPLGRVLLYSLHLEVFTGITGRLLQFAGAHLQRVVMRRRLSRCFCADVLNDARMPGQPAHQVIMGDLNTMAHRRALRRLLYLLC